MVVEERVCSQQRGLKFSLPPRREGSRNNCSKVLPQPRHIYDVAASGIKFITFYALHIQSEDPTVQLFSRLPPLFQSYLMNEVLQLRHVTHTADQIFASLYSALLKSARAHASCP